MSAERVLDGLNEQQRQAVTCPTTPLCILAGAGTGKTRVLTRRIAYRALTGDHDPRHVLALTFTRKAAGELSSRLRQLGLRDSVAAGTFHAVAFAQLRGRWADRGVRPPELLDRKLSMVARLLPSGHRANAIDIVTEIEWAKARALSPEDYLIEARRLHRRAPVPQEEMAAIFQCYEDEKRTRRMVDFDDLLRLCRRDLLEDRDFARTQRWRFQHLFVDEFQDVNPLQRSLLEAWLGASEDLTVVGDPNQAIYAWNGADPTAITGFADRYPSAEVIRLSENYRSSPQILAVANSVLAGGALDETAATPTTGDAGLHANRPDGPVPTVTAADDDEAEARAVARSIRDRHGPGTRWSSQAVLCRTNAQTALIERALHDAAIPFRMRGGGGLLDQPEIKAALREMTIHQGDFAVAITDLEASAGRVAEALEPAPGGAGRDAHDDPDPDAVDHANAANPGRSDRAANLAVLARLARDFGAIERHPTPAGFEAWLTETTRSDQPDQQGDAVEIATFHAAKGLEWPVVHLTGIEQGYVPIAHAKDADGLAEERRLFYVAITRAERELHLTWSRQRTFGARAAARNPSPYLDEVDAACGALRDGAVPADWTTLLAGPRQHLHDAAGPDRAARIRRDTPAGATTAVGDLDPTGLATFDALKAWRGRRARAADVAPFVIFHDRVLVEVAASSPRSRDDLLAVSGIGEMKVQRFGDEILGIVAEHATS